MKVKNILTMSVGAFVIAMAIIVNGCSLFPNDNTSIPEVFKNPDNWYLLQVDTASKAITRTYFAGGLVGDEFQVIGLSSDGVVIGQVENSVSSTKGYSYIPLDKVDNPVGNIVNWISVSSFGAWNWVIGTFIGSDGDLYVVTNDNAKNNGDIRTVILKASTKEEVASFPFWGGVSDTWFNKMAVDNSGDIWTTFWDTIASKVFIVKIDSDFSSYSVEKGFVVDESDSEYSMTARFFKTTNSVWILGYNYIFRVDGNSNLQTMDYADTPFHKTDEQWNDQWIEGFFIHNGKTYAYAPNSSGSMSLYFVTGTTFTYLTDFDKKDYFGNPIDKGFSYNGLYYFPTGQVFDPSTNTVSDEDFPVVGGSWGEGNIYASDGSNIIIQATVYKDFDTIPVRIFKDGVKYELTPSNTSDGLMQNNIKYLYLDSNKDLYVAYPARGYSKIDRALQVVTEDFPSYIKEITEYNDEIYAGTDRGLYKIDENNSLVADYSDLGYRENSTNEGGSGFMEFINGSLWISTDGTWNEYSPKPPVANINLLTGEIKTDEIWTLSIEERSDIVDYGVDPETNQVVTIYRKSPEDPDPDILSYNPNTNAWTEMDKPEVSGDFHWWSLINTKQDLYLFDYSDTSTLYKRKDGKWVLVIDGIDWWTNGIPVDGIKLDKYLVVYGGAEGFLLIDEENKKWVKLTKDNCPIPSNRVNSVVIDDLGGGNYRIWFGTDTGLCYMQSNISEWDF